MSVFYQSILVFLLISIVGMEASAQKFGHVNFGNLIEDLPEVITADQEISYFRDSLDQILQAKQDALLKDLETNQQKYAQGELSQVEISTINKELNLQQQRLVNLDKQYREAVFSKREVILEPIIKRARLAVRDYGKKMGYTAIFDESSGYILYDEPSNDLTESIRAILLDQ